MLDKVVLVRVGLVVRGVMMAIIHHGLEPHRFPVQVFCRGDFTAEDAVVPVLLQLASKDQAGAKEREDVEVVQQDGDTHILAEDFYSFNVGERARPHAEGYEIQGACHGVGDHDI